MKNYEGPSNNTTEKSSDWDKVAALANQYQQPNVPESNTPTKEEPVFHIKLSSKTIYRRSAPTPRPQETQEVPQNPQQYHIKFGNKFNQSPISPEQRERLTPNRPEQSNTEPADETTPPQEKAASPVQPPDPREVLNAQRRDRAIASQAAINTIESQIKLNTFQKTAVQAKLDDFKTSHGFLKRRFGKTATEFRNLQHQLELLDQQRSELDQELSAARQRHAATTGDAVA